MGKQTKMGKDLSDHRRFFDGSDDFQFTLTMGTAFDVDIEQILWYLILPFEFSDFGYQRFTRIDRLSTQLAMKRMIALGQNLPFPQMIRMTPLSMLRTFGSVKR